MRYLKYLLFILILFIFVWFLNHPQSLFKKVGSSNPSSSTVSIYLIGKFKVNYVTDGDTIHVLDQNGKEDIVRFLVVNTPEIHTVVNGRKIPQRDICLGQLAKAFTKENLLNKNVELCHSVRQADV